jgi:SAM-dependent methyltransferase
MRYRLTSSSKKRMAQILTPPHLAARLVDMLSDTDSDWLELGSGNGRIAQACVERKSPRKYVGVELDPRLLAASEGGDKAKFVHANVLSPCDLDEALEGKLFTRTAGNPPYGIQVFDKVAQQRLAALCPGIPQVMSWGQLDLYFVLESLARLSRPGEAAFIVGAPIAEDSRLAAFREALIESASEVECYELPPDVFGAKAEVQSYLLVAKFGSTRLKGVQIGRMRGDTLSIVDQRLIPIAAAISRLDIAYHEFVQLDQAVRARSGCATLQELGASIIRGSRTRSEFDLMEIEYFHTSDFPVGQMNVDFGDDHDHGFQVARAGDILLPRVGTRCLDRQAVVGSGRRHFTEAVYRVRVPPKARLRVIQWIASDSGLLWRQSIAKGSCAKHVTVESLFHMPVPPIVKRLAA